MPSNQEKPSAYSESKDECKEIVDAIIGGMGVVHQNGVTHENKPFRRSSREAVKAVFKDPEIGQDALDYFRGVKEKLAQERQVQEGQEEPVTYEQLALEEGDNEFKDRIKETRDLFENNTRNLKPKDYFNPRVVGKKKAAISAGAVVATVAGAAVTAGVSAAVTAPAVASAIAAPAIESVATAGVSGLFNLAAAYYASSGPIALPIHTHQQNQKGKSVTKINPEKKVDADSNGIDYKYKPTMRQYQDLDLDYKDVLYEKMTGSVSKNYGISQQRLGRAVDDYVGVLEQMANGKTQKEASDIVNSQEKKEVISDVAKHITSFVSTRPPRTHAEQVESSRDNSEHSR